MKLHYSQTLIKDCLVDLLFKYLMKLHYSQTDSITSSYPVKV